MHVIFHSTEDQELRLDSNAFDSVCSFHNGPDLIIFQTV